MHVSSYARLAHLEYRRQALVAESRCLEAANMQLRFEVERARAQGRVTAAAQEWGMTLADPASQVDYVLLPAAAVTRGPGLYALLRDSALAQQVASVITADTSSAMQTAAVTGQRVGRP